MIRSVDGRSVGERSGPWVKWEVVYTDFRRAVAKSLFAPAPPSVRKGDVYVTLFLGHATVQVNALAPNTSPGGGLSWSLAANTYTPASWGCQAGHFAYSPDDTPRSVGVTATAGANFQIALATFVIRGVRAYAPASNGSFETVVAASAMTGQSVTAEAEAFVVTGIRGGAGNSTLGLSASAVADGWVLTGAEPATAAMAAAYRFAPAGSVAGAEITSSNPTNTTFVTIPFLHTP